MLMRTTPIDPDRARPRLSELAFCVWLGQAVPGDRLEYHRGFLVCDTFEMPGQMPGQVPGEPADRAGKELARLAARAHWAARKGLVHLVQERLGPSRFAYVAIARARHTPSATALATLYPDTRA